MRRHKRRRKRRSFRRWAADVARSPRTKVLTKVFGLLASALLVLQRVAELLHQLSLL